MKQPMSFIKNFIRGVFATFSSRQLELLFPKKHRFFRSPDEDIVDIKLFEAASWAHNKSDEAPPHHPSGATH